MQIRELGFVLRYIEEVWTKYELQQKYAALIQTLAQIKTNTNDDLRQDLARQYKELLELQEKLQPTEWAYLREKIFNEFGASEHIGLGAVGRLKLAFDSNAGDTQSLQSDIQKLHDELTQFKQGVDTLKSQLGNLIRDESDELTKDRGILQLVFEGEATIETVSDLKNIAKDWGMIIRGFSLITKTNEADAKILRISKGSSTILEIEGVLKILIVMGRVSTAILGLLLLRLQIEKLQLETKSLKMKEASDAMDKGLDERIKQGTKNILDEIIKESGWTKEHKPDGEIVTSAQKSIELMFDYMSKGTKVDIATSAKEENEQPGTPRSVGFRFALSNKYKEVRRLQSDVGERKKLLEAQLEKKETAGSKKQPVKKEDETKTK